MGCGRNWGNNGYRTGRRSKRKGLGLGVAALVAQNQTFVARGGLAHFNGLIGRSEIAGAQRRQDNRHPKRDNASRQPEPNR